jgi:cysteine synthase A
MLFHATHQSIIDAVELPRIIRLGPNLYGAVFFLMKLLPARYILDMAEREGVIEPGSTIIETTSGTFGLALAMLCNQRNYRLILVSDPAIDAPLQRRLTDLGARVEIVSQPAEIGGYQGARLDRMAELQAEHPGHFCPSQYSNRYNPEAYSALGELLMEVIGPIDCLVGSVGSGGSMCGTSSHLRTLRPELQAIAVDTLGSVLFGQPDQQRVLRGLGNSLMPQNVNHSVFDEVHWVSAAEAFRATRVLHQKHSLFMGPTSGAAYLVAQWWADQHPHKDTVVILPDEGYRYQETVYNDDWLRTSDVWCQTLPQQPRLVNHPLEAGPEWSFFHWQQRSYEQVIGHPFQAGVGR